MKKKLTFLQPGKINVGLTVLVLCMPLLKERVLLETGGYVVERYQPIVLWGLYLWMRDWWPFLLMTGYSLVVYFLVSVGMGVVKKIGKISEKVLVKRGN